MFVRTRNNIRWSEDSIKHMAEVMVKSITNGKSVSLQEYINLARTVSMNKMGFSLAWILKREGKLIEFLPDEVAKIISARLERRYLFDRHACSFIRAHQDMTSEEIGMLLFTDGDAVKRKAKKMGVKIKKSTRYHFSPEDDAVIEKYVDTDLNQAAIIIGVSERSVFQRAKMIGLVVTKKRFVKYSEEELEILEQGFIAKQTDAQIAKKLKNRTVESVGSMRLKLGKLKRSIFSWKHWEYKWQYILENYQTMTYQQIADNLCLTRAQVAQKASKEGLRKIKLPKAWPYD